MSRLRFILATLALPALLFVSACGDSAHEAADTGKDAYPTEGTRHGSVRDTDRGNMSGDGGFLLFGGKKKDDGTGANIGVNGFLWRATLDTLSFMPIASADPFGGVVITDWYEDPKTPGERYKINAFILDRSLRADAVRVKLFKQAKSETGWKDAAVSPRLSRDVEDTILTRARQLRVIQLQSK